MRTQIKFYYNGIKVNNGKLEKIGWSAPQQDGMIYGFANSYCGLSKEIKELFTVENNTDSVTDLFEKDILKIQSNHPLYNEAKKALIADLNKSIKRCIKNGRDYKHYQQDLNSLV